MDSCDSKGTTMISPSNRLLRIFVGWLTAAGLGGMAVAAMQSREYKSGIVWPEPKVIEPGSPTAAPSDAVVLFDGKDLSQWKGGEDWEIKDGYAISRKHDITTKDKFGDCQLHLEFATPEKVVGSGQGAATAVSF